MELKDWLCSINRDKNDLLEDDDAGIVEKEYVPFIVNRCLSYHPELIYLVNEMNSRALTCDKKMQYHFLLFSVSKRSRFSPWEKQEKLENVEVIKRYYGYNNKRAREVLRVLSEEDILYIKERLEHGTKMTVLKEKIKKNVKREK